MAEGHEPETERSLVGSLIFDASKFFEVQQIVDAADFLEPKARAVYEAIGEMIAEGTAVDAQTIAAHLSKSGREQEVGGAVGLLPFIHNEYASFVPHSAHAIDYALDVRRQAQQRRLRALFVQATADAEVEDPEIVSGRVIDRLTMMGITSAGTAEMKLVDAACVAVDLQSDPDAVYLSTGYADFDRSAHGLGRGELVILAGRPYVGKTLFALNVATRMTTVQECRVLFVSLEMEATALAEPAILFSTGLTAKEFAERARADVQGMKATVGAKLGDRAVWIQRRHRLTGSNVVGLIRRARAKYGIDVVIIDNLHLMEDERAARNGGRVQEIAAITRGLKIAASETKTVVIAISHLNRMPERRRDARPTMADLRDSGAIEQDADVVAFLFRADLQAAPPVGAQVPTSYPVELIVRKRRNGRACMVPFHFFPADCSFRPACTQSVETPPAPARPRRPKEGGFSCAQE